MLHYYHSPNMNNTLKTQMGRSYKALCCSRASSTGRTSPGTSNHPSQSDESAKKEQENHVEVRQRAVEPLNRAGTIEHKAASNSGM